MGNRVKHIVTTKDGVPLITVHNGKQVRVTKEQHRGTDLYRLRVDGKIERTKSDKDKIITEYYTWIQKDKNVETIVYEPVNNNPLGLPIFTPEQLGNWQDIDHVLTSEFPKYTPEQLEELKKGKTKEELQIIDDNLKDIEQEAYKVSIESIWNFTNEQNIKKIEEETGKKVTTNPIVNIKKVTQKVRVEDEDENIVEEFEVEKYQTHSVDKHYIIKEFLQLLKDNPNEVAALAKIPQLAILDKLYMPKIEKTALTDFLTEYENHINQVSESKENKNKSISSAKIYIDEFEKIVKIKTGKVLVYIEDITHDDIQAYLTEIYKVATDKNYTAKWLTEQQIKQLKSKSFYPKNVWYKHRVVKLRTLFNNYISAKIADNESAVKKTIDNILFWLSKAKKLNGTAINAKIITKEEFKKLYKACNEDFKLYMSICVLNGYTFADLANLKVEEINFVTGEILKRREKTGEIRIGYLPPVILQKIKDRLEQEYIFPNFSSRTKRTYFANLTNKVELKKIQFKMLRKTTATTATLCPGINELQIKLLMGHSIKIETHYIQKSMEAIKKIVEFIYQEYLQDIV